MTQHTGTVRLTRELGTLYRAHVEKVAKGSQTIIKGQGVFDKRGQKKDKKKKRN